MGEIGASGKKGATLYADGLSAYPRFASAAAYSGAYSASRSIGSKALNHRRTQYRGRAEAGIRAVGESSRLTWFPLFCENYHDFSCPVTAIL